MIVLLILLACSAVVVAYLIYTNIQRTKQYGKLRDLTDKNYKLKEELDRWNMQVAAATEAFQRLGESINTAKGTLSEVNHSIEVAKVARDSAQELAEKDLQLEAEKRRAEFETQLQAEYEALREKSSAVAYQRLLDNLNDKIEKARQTLKTEQDRQLKMAEQEDFISAHSIELTEQDLQDIDLIRSFAPRLSRKEAFFKLIWTEFYQRPLQALCKILQTEKVTGIYMITSTKTKRMYVGQAIDIAARWKEHVKCGLGIGSTSYLTNKFYHAMHDEGPENFTFEILEVCERDQLNERERHWIEFYNANTFGYNSKVGG